MGALGILLIAQRQRANLKAFFSGVGVAFPVFLTAMHLQVPSGHEFMPVQILWHRIMADGMAPGMATDDYHGGAVGAVISVALRKTLGDTGAIIALGALAIVALLVLTNLSLAETMGRAGRGVKQSARRAGSKDAARLAARRRIGLRKAARPLCAPIGRTSRTARNCAAALHRRVLRRRLTRYLRAVLLIPFRRRVRPPRVPSAAVWRCR